MKPAIVPKVSICSQILNQTKWAKDMIQSVVDQTFRNWELIIVDDGSTEDLKSVIDSFNDRRIKYHRFDENRGVPFGTNWALKQAQGKYICLIAADEVYYRTKLQDQVIFLDNNPKVDCVWGLPGNGDDHFPMGPRPEWEQYQLSSHNRSREAWLRTLLNLEKIPIGGCGLMMRKSAADALGGLDENLRIFSDHEFYVRFFEAGYKGVIVPHRWAVDRPFAENTQSVRLKNHERTMEELTYVREKHPLVLPPSDGKVTVAIACHNHARYLKDAVDSVLAQTRPVDEIMILDDGSEDNFKEVAAQFTDPRIRVMAFEKNQGREEAWNYMAFTCKNEFFVTLAADDTIDPSFVEKCLAKFKEDPWTEFVATQTDFFLEDMKTPAPDSHPFRSIPPATSQSQAEWRGTFIQGNVYFGTGMYRTHVIAEVGGWEKEFKVISDYQMYLKLIFRENIVVIEEPLTHTRCHGKNDSLLNAERYKELPWLYHAAKKRFFPPQRKVIIATPFYELKAFSPYVTSLVNTTRLLQAVGIDYRFMELSGDSYVHRARNTMCDMFLRDPDATDLFFIDSDMSWNPEAFVKMCLLPDDVVGAAYPVKNNWQAWTSIPQLEDLGKEKRLRGRPLGDGTHLIEAMVLAGGFLRIKRDVLERFRDHYKDAWYVEPTTDPKDPQHKFVRFFGSESIDHKFFGEDHYFAKHLRDMGIKMFIYPNVDIVHWGYKDFGGNYHNFLKEQQFIPEGALTSKPEGQRLVA